MVHSSAKLAETLPAHRAPEPTMARPGLTLRERIGNTPLLRFDQLTAQLPRVTLLGKAEWHNPGGSVKDRAAANIVAEGHRHRQVQFGQNPARRHKRQHRHRLRHAGCG